MEKKKGKLYRKEERAFYIFVAPWLIGFVCLTVGPMLYSLYAAFTDWNGISQPIFTELANFKTILFEDEKFWLGLKNTLYFACFSVPINLIVALLLAVMLNKKYRGSTFFRSMIYLPSVVAGVAVYIVWVNLFNTDIGFINHMLSFLGIEGPAWLTDTKWAMPAIILMTITFCGGTMLIFLAGLQDIPESLYEAARVDGASTINLFFNITLPMLSPVIFYNLIIGIIGGLQVFTQPVVMTAGGPSGATYVYGMHIYDNAFKYYKFGYACALAWVLFVIVMALSAFVMKTSKSWVHTEAAD